MRNLVIALVLVLAVPAEAAVRPRAGAYRGGAAGTTVSFRVTTARTIHSLKTGRLVARCDRGGARGASIATRPGEWTVRPSRRGVYRKVAGVLTEVRVGRLGFAARFTTATRARVTLQIRFTHTPTGARCDTGALRFVARRQGSAPAWRRVSGRTEDGSPLTIAVSADGTVLRPARMQARMTCADGSTVTLNVTNPIGPSVPAGTTFRGTWRYAPPAVPGHAAPSGGAVELSGRVTPTSIEGAARLSVGFTDGIGCDSGWTLFRFAATSAVG